MADQFDKSGIYSLAGFAYQIKVFAYYSFDLNKDMQIEFETIDDVNLKFVKRGQLDNNSHKYICKITENGINKTIQVKHTSVSKKVAKQLILNWILLEGSSYNIENYILFTEAKYKNKDNIFSEDMENLYEEIQRSEKKENSAMTKVKNLYKNDKAGFFDAYECIKNKFEFISIENLDEEINEKASIHFRKEASETIFAQRMNEYLQKITCDILDAINNVEPFILSFKKFMDIVEDISQRFSKKITLPSYSEFKKINSIDLTSSKFSSSREYLQLKMCNLSDYLLETNLIYNMYYSHTRLLYMENNKFDKIDDIQETTFENFQKVKYNLSKNNQDTPYNRLEETQKFSNSYAYNEQIKYGSCIYLTRDDIQDIQISWKDKDNE